MDVNAAVQHLKALPPGEYVIADLRRTFKTFNLQPIINAVYPKTYVPQALPPGDILYIEPTGSAGIGGPEEREIRERVRSLPPGQYDEKEIAERFRRNDMNHFISEVFGDRTDISWIPGQKRMFTIRPNKTREISFGDAVELLGSGRITSYIVDPQNQVNISPGMTRVTLIGIDGSEHDVVARYDPVTGQIFPPN